VTCHDDQAKKIDSAKVPHPGAQSDCTSCHTPHASRTPRLLTPNPVEACLTCHDNQAQAYKTKKVLHDPVFNQKCSICHEGHGGTRDKLLRDNLETLCLTCHGPDAKALAGKDADAGMETILGKAVTLPAGYVAKAPKISLNAGLGHPVPMHPVAGVDPRDKSKQLNCISCHDPHAGDGKNMLTSKDSNVRELCGSCHVAMRAGKSNSGAKQ
jgi:predicted CXXCH cytochrome family protein